MDFVNKRRMKDDSKQVRVTITQLDGSVLDIAAVSPPLPGDIHIWEFGSEMPGSGAEDIAALLSRDERERAARFHFQRDAQRYTVTRARTRTILGAYLQSDPRELKFTYSAREKPSLASASADIRFNVSHSGDQAMVAVAIGREIGIDIEQVRSNVECEKLAERLLFAGRAQIHAKPP